MALKCGIVGLPNIGKSTLFNVLSNSKVIAENFPFATIEPNVGIVSVPDKRIDELTKILKPEKTIHTTIEFLDIAGLVKGASKGEGLGNQFLANIREVDAIIHVVRCFDDPNVIHVAGSVDPLFDKEIIDHELQLKDLETVNKRILKIQKQVKAKDKEAISNLNILNKIKTNLENKTNIRNISFEKEEYEKVKTWQLLTAKPVLYLANIDEKSLIKGDNEYSLQLKKIVEAENTQVITISASLEAQILELEQDERELFINEYNLRSSGLEKLILGAYKLLNLITYFTAGKQEVKAWTIQKGTQAPAAAGVIHSDFEKGFIKAEVIKFEDYVQYKSEHECKKAGKIAIEGKDYLVEDGDIIHFRFNN